MFLATGALDDASARCTFAAAMGSSTNPTHTYTFKNQNIGAPSASRVLVLVVYAQNANLSATGYIDSLTVGGQSATSVFLDQVGSITQSIWVLPFPGGTIGNQADVVATRNTGNGFAYVYIAMFAAYFLNSSTPIDVQTGATVLLTLTLDTITDAGGFLIASSLIAGGFPTTYDGATSVCDITVGVAGVQQLSAAIKAPTVASAAYPTTTTTTNPNGTNQFTASFR